MENNPRKPYNGFIGTTRAKILGLVLAFVVTFLMMYFGAYTKYCLFVFVGALLFVIPKAFGVKSFKAMAVLGVMFFLVTSFVGAYLVTIPAIEDAQDTEIKDTFYGYDVQQISGTDDYNIYIYYDGASAPKFYYTQVTSCSFEYLFGTQKTADMSVVSGHLYTTKVTLSDDNVYLVSFEADGKRSQTTVIDETIGSDTLQKTAIAGNMYVNGIPTVMFFLVLLFSTWMRRNFEKQRAKFEAEGRLYPKGYGLCKKCGMTVLPGEKVCRKCGEPIDIPEEIQRATLAKLYGTEKCPNCGNDVIKIEKVCPKCKTQMPGREVLSEDETFKCSECGTDVPVDADKCPMCGARFDDDSDESAVEGFKCSECGELVPSNAEFCEKCGAKFDKD